MSFTPPIGDATSSAKGVVRLTGDLGGTAASPTVPGLASKIDSSQKGAANGVATLDGSSLLPTAQLPTIPLAALPAGTRLACPWNSGTSKWRYNGVDLNARPSARTDIFFVLTGAPAATADPVWALAGDKREDI
jgi:hypothetical protein